MYSKIGYLEIPTNFLISVQFSVGFCKSIPLKNFPLTSLKKNLWIRWMLGRFLEEWQDDN